MPPDAVSGIEVVLQVRTEVDGGAITATGCVIFCEMICDVAEVHPLVAVTVTV